LYEAILLVVFVSLIGFWEWRLALIMALAIPINVGHDLWCVIHASIDLQQVSVATLIIALGLLVDVPSSRVMASSAVWPMDYHARSQPGWVPTKLATAIFSPR